jgi:hypothetical protein
MKWSDVLARDDLVGGQIETEESGDLYRGPIDSIEKRGGTIVISAGRIDTRPVSGGEWKPIDNPPPLMLNPEQSPDPRDLGDGRIAFTMPFLGTSTITPKGWAEPGPAGADNDDEVTLPTGTQMDWRIVADLKPMGYAEVRPMVGEGETPYVLHGPVGKVVVNDLDFVEIHFEWLARMPLTAQGVPDGSWGAANSMQPQIFPNLVVPFVFEETPEKGPRVRFGLNILYLNEVPGIDPAEVKGLELPKPAVGAETAEAASE